MITNKKTSEVFIEEETVRMCPKCGKKYTDYPATSRADGKTEICPECGMREAIEAARLYYSNKASN